MSSVIMRLLPRKVVATETAVVQILDSVDKGVKPKPKPQTVEKSQTRNVPAATAKA